MNRSDVCAWDLRNRAFAERVAADWQGGVPIQLSAVEEWAGSPQGQSLLFQLANQLPRMGPGFRRIRACQGCIHGKEGEAPREEREATLVFVSALTAAVLAREFLLTLLAGPEAAQHSNRVNGNAFEPWSVESTKDLPDPQCEICRGVRLVCRAD